ncbi:MAG TPA: rhodanese-like domain-containing protein [Bryobacteraceae bacterium]|nr:rhodanese-like domain-containing protein [Bryobacteraceae bacterium]
MSHSPEFLKIVNDAKARVKEMTVADYAKLPAGSYTLVDIREDNEFAAGHAAGSIHIGKGVIERDIEAKIPDKATPLALYCGGGFRSALAADALQIMGYTKVVSLDGGWRQWNELGLPIEK